MLSVNYRSWHIAALEMVTYSHRWSVTGDANHLIQKYVKSITARNYSTLALSTFHQLTVARSCIRRATVSFISNRKLLIQCRYTNIIDDRHLLARNA